MAAQTPTKTLTAHCFCRAVHYKLTIPITSLPLRTHLCHCGICRFTHGAPCVFHAPLPVGITPQWVAPSGPHNLTSYRHTSGALSDRVFCSTCGCQIGDIWPAKPINSKEDEEKEDAADNRHWTISTSIFTEHSPSNFQIDKHIFTDSAPGKVGLHQLLPRISRRDMEIYTGHFLPPNANRILPPPPAPPQAEFGNTDSKEERLRCECHCGGVSFTFPRPTKAILGNSELNKFVSPTDPRKWLASLDLCDDCRLLNGTHVTAWTFLPLQLLEPAVGTDLIIGTSKTFESSKGVRRAFCGTCGATVFYWSEDRADIVDVALGLVRASEGLFAESWVTWRNGRVAYQESGERFDRDFAEAVALGIKSWGAEREGEVLDIQIGLLRQNAPPGDVGRYEVWRSAGSALQIYGKIRDH
ncbi:predicted protein [Histoplasma mississippiense (nom. inval.)]|uniref:predicted protein n=1 Tax=Ajellomyces capsulatus (strain NAm1 / WU24) TaxID=2059318 RepID=UPI000157BF7B|nr:predicted protein [Histoplasma mississippiense (nom. inval.)]EDN06799.1 predicted protein [Histoplasma mississippiense (nom. inval.)]